MSNLANPDYWQSRAERLILAGEKSADQMLTDLQKVYRDTYNGIQKEIDAFYGKYSTEQGITLTEAQKRLNKSELKDAKAQIQEYYDAIKETNYAYDPLYKQRLSRLLSAKAYMSRLEALQEQVQWQIENLYAKEQQALKSGLESTYEDAYYQSTFNLQQGLGFSSPFSTLNTSVIEKAVKAKWLGENYSDRIWANKDLLTQTLERVIPNGIAAGQNPKIIGRAIHDRMFGQGTHKGRGGMLWRSINLARTEFNHLTNDAAFDSYVNSEVVESYKYLATLDGRTTDSCADMDGKIFLLSERMVGINYPPIATPPHPCRSTTVPHFPLDEIDAMFDTEAKRIARDPETNRAYFVPAELTYSQWRESLTESQGKAFLSAEKMDKYYQSDKNQFASYKEFIREAKKEHGTELVSGLFSGFPTKFQDFQSMKYLGRYERDGEMIRIDWEDVKGNRQRLS